MLEKHLRDRDILGRVSTAASAIETYIRQNDAIRDAIAATSRFDTASLRLGIHDHLPAWLRAEEERRKSFELATLTATRIDTAAINSIAAHLMRPACLPTRFMRRNGLASTRCHFILP